MRTSRPGDRAVGLLLVLSSAAAFGAMPVLAKVAYRSGVEPVALLAVRFAVALALLLAARAVVGAERAGPWPRGRALGALLALGGGVYLAQSLSYFRGLELAPAALIAIMLYLFPAIVVVLSAVFLRERPTVPVAGCLLLSVLGVALTVGPVRGSVDPLGPLLGVVSALCYSVYIVASSRLVPRIGPLTSICVVVGGATAGYTAIALATRPAWPQDLRGWLATVAVGVLGTAFAMLAFFAGLARLGPTDSSVASTLEPVVTAVLGVVVLSESLTGIQAAGAVLVLAAVVVLTRVRARPATPAGVGLVAGRSPGRR